MGLLTLSFYIENVGNFIYFSGIGDDLIFPREVL